MAANIVRSDTTKELCRRRDQALRNVRAALNDIAALTKAMEAMRDGADNAGDPANYDILALEGGYQQGDYATANAAARESFKQVEAVFGHVYSAGAIEAVNQACAYHGIV